MTSISNFLLIPTGLLALNPLIYFLINSLGWRNTLRIASVAVMATGVGAVYTFIKPPRENTDLEMKYIKIEGIQRIEEKENLFADQMNGNDMKQNDEQKTGLNSDLLQKKMMEKEESKLRFSQEPRALSVLRHPELWMLASALVVCCAGVCFFYMSLVRHQIFLFFYLR